MHASLSWFRAATAPLLAASILHAQPCNPYPFRPSMLPPCDTIGAKVGRAVAASIEVKAKFAELSEAIDRARRRYWAAFPDGPGLAEAEAQYLDALAQKTAAYLMMNLVSGMKGPAVTMINTLNFGPGVTVDQYRQRLKGDITMVDGGLHPAARPLFAQWVNALRRGAGAMKDGDMVLNPAVLGVAISRPSGRRQAYERAQYWTEVLSSGIDLRKYFTPELYIQLMMETRVSTQLGEAQTADIPDCQAATVALYETFVRIMGAKEVAAAAAAVLAAPKSPWGDLATPVSLDLGINQGVTSEPFLRFLDLLVRGSPRTYAIALLLDPYQLNSHYVNRAKWLEAAARFDQLVRQHGEAPVLAAAGKVLAARKSANGGIRGDPQYRPTNAWFDLALKDPKLVVPDGDIPHFKASSYSSRWLGRHLAVRGTVSRVNVERGGRPEYAVIYFNESPRNQIVAFTPYSRELQGVYGSDFSGLVGRPVEIYGEVQDWREVAGVRVLDPRQIAVVDGGFHGPDADDSKPAWLSEPEPQLVENPRYAEWKKFPAGTTVTLVDRMFFETEAGTDRYQRTDTGRTILRLESIDAERAVIASNSTTATQSGVPSSSGGSVTHKAKLRPENVSRPRPDESGDEILEISGKKFATRWEKTFARVPGSNAPDPGTYTQTWFSGEVPGGRVLVRQQSHNEILGKSYRRYSITLIEPVAGIEPEFGPLQPGAKKSALLVTAESVDELRKRYTDLGERVSATKLKVQAWQKERRWIRPPPKIEEAVMYLDIDIRKVWPAIMSKNAAAAATAIQTVEDKLAVIDEFLKSGKVPPDPKK